MKKAFALTAAAVLTLMLTQLILSVYASTSSASDAPWWNDAWHYRTPSPYTLYLGDYDRKDVPFEKTLNFTSLLSQFNESGTFDENSIRVIEYNAAGDALWEVPSQFEKAAHYNATFRVYGTVAWVVNGTTAAGTSRIYYIYFDVLENGPKSPPNYTGVSSRISGDYVIIVNEKINATIRYKNGVYLESLRFDRNLDGIFESNEEMIDSTNPYTLLIRVTDLEKDMHNWTDPFFQYSRDENATVTVLKNGPIQLEIGLSDVNFKNTYGEALDINATLLFRVYKLSARVDLKTVFVVNEDIDVQYAYERAFLDHKDLYDRWYVDEDYNGRFTYSEAYKWVFSGIPNHGFLSSYNASGNGGLAFVPSVQHYSKIYFGEYKVEGPAIRLEIGGGTWPIGKLVELENRLFVHVGNRAAVMEEMRKISSPPVLVTTLSVHLVDYNNLDLVGAELKIYDLNGNVARTAFTGETGWVVLEIEADTYELKAFLMSFQVAEYRLSFSTDMTIDPLECAVYNLSVSCVAIDGSDANGITVGIYRFNGTRMTKSETNSTGNVFFQQLPAGSFIIKTYHLAEQFGATKSISLSTNTELTINEEKGLGVPRQIRYDIVYILMLGGFAAAVAVAILKVKKEKFILGLFIGILILAIFLTLVHFQNSHLLSGSSGSGISASYDKNTGYITVGDVIKVRWNDLDRDGGLDDSNLFVTTSNGTELFKIDSETILTTPASIYSLSEADAQEVFFFDKTVGNYILYRPLSEEPNFKNREYQRSLNLRFVFSKTNEWEVALNTTLEMGKPYLQMRWEITEKGGGEGDYSIYPQIIPSQPLDRLILPTNYTDNRLRFWNQKDGPTYANPWRAETDWPLFGAFVANMHVNNPDVYLHSGENYAIQTRVHASSVFARYSIWVHNKAASYFQYDFWVDWDGNTPPTSDIEIEVWVPDALDLANSTISYSPDGSRWIEYDGWTLTEGNRGENGFSSYGGCRHRLKITFPANDFIGDDGTDTGRDYGVPYARNDEYLVRLRVAYQNEGLTTYEFENSSNMWYGLRNINDSWVWLVDTKQDLSIGIVLSERLENLMVQANDMETYRNVTMGFNLPLTSNGRAVFHTNFVLFTGAQAGRQDQDSDGVWNMFDENMPQFFSLSVPQTSRETFGQLGYNEGFNQETNVFHMRLTKKPTENDWNHPPKYTVYLPNRGLQRLQGDDAVFLFERNGYYVYDVWQTSEVMWSEKAGDPYATYPLYVSLGLIVIGAVMLFRYSNIVRKYKVIFILLIVSLTIRLFLQSFSTEFGGSDAAVYGNVAQNFVNYGQLQVNYIALEPHYIRLRMIPIEITHPYNNPARLIYPCLLTFSFVMFGQSSFAIKSVDVILGALLVIPTFYLAKKLFNEKTAIVATTIVAFHPLLVHYSGPFGGSTGMMTTFLATVALCAMVYEGNKTALLAGFFVGLSLFARMEFGFILLGVVLGYYFLTFRQRVFRMRSLYVIILVFLIALALLFYLSYAILGRFPISTKMLGGTWGEINPPSLWETLTDPDFVQIRMYNALYGWWYILFLVSPVILIMAIAGLLLNIKSWRTLSALYLYPFCGIFVFSFAVREQPHARFLIEYMPVMAILSASFIIALSQFLLPRLTDRPRPERNIKSKQILTVFLFIEIIFMSFFPHYIAIDTSMQNLAWKFDDGEIYEWIKTNTSPKSVIMAYSVVYVFHTHREIVTIPRPRGPEQPVDMSMIIYLIKRYNIDYIVICRTELTIPDLRNLRSNPMNAPSGFNLVYWDEDPTNFDPRVLIYDVRALRS